LQGHQKADIRTFKKALKLQTLDMRSNF